ncbi:MAG: hypothetical protein ACRAS9_00195 [Mycoplasma sp.]
MAFSREKKLDMWNERYGDKEVAKCRCFCPMHKNKLGKLNEDGGWDVGVKMFKKDDGNPSNYRPLCKNCIANQKKEKPTKKTKAAAKKEKK